MIPLRWSPHHPLSLSHKSNLLPLYSTFFLCSAPEDWLYNGEQVISRVPRSFLPAPLRLTLSHPQLVTLEIGTGAASTHLWRDYTLPLHTVSRCQLCQRRQKQLKINRSTLNLPNARYKLFLAPEPNNAFLRPRSPPSQTGS